MLKEKTNDFNLISLTIKALNSFTYKQLLQTITKTEQKTHQGILREFTGKETSF